MMRSGAMYQHQLRYDLTQQPFTEVTMSRYLDITGQTFGRLLVVERAGKSCFGSQLWLCHCACGEKTFATTNELKRSSKKSCGCLQRERGSVLNRTHGQSRSRLWNIWSGMRQRCGDPNASNFSRYGGRGIKVCEEWQQSFEVFRDWAMANGYQKHLTLDRWSDKNGNYEPSNCRWATYKQQSRNSRLKRTVIRSDGVVYEFLIDAARATGAGSSNILEVCEGRRQTAGGFGWRYDE